MATAIRETDHPQWREWYVRYALLDDRVLVLGDHKLAHNGHFEDWWKRYEVVSSRYIAGQVFKCQCGCGNCVAVMVNDALTTKRELRAFYADHVGYEILSCEASQIRSGEIPMGCAKKWLANKEPAPTKDGARGDL